MYKKNHSKSRMPKYPCISVGNISWGGTGKTVLISWLLKELLAKEFSPCVISRGYNNKSRNYPFIIDPKSSAEDAGDEPLLLAKKYPQAKIIVDPIRTRACEFIEKQKFANFILLDDAYQHLAMGRNLNLLLFSMDDLENDWNRVHPVGSWREPVSALFDADIFFIKAPAKELSKVHALVHEKLLEFSRPVYVFDYNPKLPSNIKTDKTIENVGRYLLVSATGLAEHVHNTAQKCMGEKAVEHIIYPDHHNFTQKDVHELEQKAKELRVDTILCTEKDAVKLATFESNIFWKMEVNLFFIEKYFTEKEFTECMQEKFYKTINFTTYLQDAIEKGQ